MGISTTESMSVKGPNSVAGRRLRVAKWVVLAAWLVGVVLAVPFAGKLSKVLDNQNSAYLPVHSGSTRVLNLQARYGGPPSLPVVVVLRRAGGLNAADLARASADRLATTTMHIPGAGPVSPLAISADRSGAVFSLSLQDSNSATDVSQQVSAVTKALGHPGGGLQIGVTGPAALSATANSAFSGIDSTLLYAAGAVVVILLLVTYRSPFLWLLPVISVGLCLEVVEALAYSAARSGLVVSSLAQGILTVIVFGAGTDYALLLVARYREELSGHADRHDAMAGALRRAAPAIAASGATVIAAMACLTLASLASTRGLGPVVCIGVATVVVGMLTLLPALLMIGGRWLFWPRVPRTGAATDFDHGPWGRLGSAISARPRRVWVATGLALGVLIIGMAATQLDLNPLNEFTGTPPAVAGQRLVAASFGPGLGTPTDVVVPQASEAAAAAVVSATPGVASVGPPTQLGGYVDLPATLSVHPYGSRAITTVDILRSRLHSEVSSASLVGGQTAVLADTNSAAAHDDALVGPLALLVVLVILMLLLRAVIAPLLVLATVVLSFAATFGASTLIFRYALGLAGIDPTIPLYTFIFLVALGVDYNIFLMTRVREESIARGARSGMRRGLAVTGGVITSAGVVLAGTFAVLAVLPLVQLTEVGVAVAPGVLIDTIVVRSILLPALVLDVGPGVWWPGRLARVGSAPHAPAGTERRSAPPEAQTGP